MNNTKKLIALALALVTLLAVGCNKNAGNDNDNNSNSNNTNSINEENGGIKNEHVELGEGEVVFRGKVTSTESNRYIEMEIADSEIAFGTYWVLVNDNTPFYNRDGVSIERADINVGDIIEVVFSGQVMNSFPPQIAAKRVYVV